MAKSFDKRLLIVDGSHYLYRAYYGVPASAKLPSGLKVNAVYGFMAYLKKAVAAVNPTGIAVVFDSETGIASKIGIERTYKANRNYTDTGMYEQLPLIKDILRYLSIRHIEPPDYEADDYIGSVARRASDNGMFSFIFSNDADFLQLISPNINVVKIGRKNPEIIDMQIFKEKYGFNSNLYLDYLSLKGDNSDNINGIPRIGHKTAQSLVTAYGSLNNIYSNSNLEKLRKRVKSMLINNRQIAVANKEFLKINTSVNTNEFRFTDAKDILFSELNKSTNYLLQKVGVNIR